MAGERFLYASAEAEASRLVDAAHGIEPDVEIEVLDEEPAFDDEYPTLIVYYGNMTEERMAARLRTATGWDVRTDEELARLPA